MNVFQKLLRDFPTGDLDVDRGSLANLIERLIAITFSNQVPLVEIISALESLSAALQNTRANLLSSTYSLSNRIFLSWHQTHLMLKGFNSEVQHAFGHLAFIVCIKGISLLSVNHPYWIVSLCQPNTTKRGEVSWLTPYCQLVKRFESLEDMDNDSKSQIEMALEIKKLFHCIFMIQKISTTEFTCWIRDFGDPSFQEVRTLAQICLLFDDAENALNLISTRRVNLDVNVLFLVSTAKLCQKNFTDALESLIHIVEIHEDEFCRNASHLIDGFSEPFLGGKFEMVSNRSIMLDCIRTIMSCLAALKFPVSIRIALCQYAWPKMQLELEDLIDKHVTDNRLFEFEQFREQILHTDIIDTFLALHRAGKLHMKLGVSQTKQGGRLLRGATRNLSITTERDLEDHIVNCGNEMHSIGPVLFSLITKDIYAFCAASKNIQK